MKTAVTLHHLLLLLFTPWSTEGLVPSVTLTVEGGVSLVGEHCPGTVRLFCEGVDLTSLRWRYNGTNKIQSFTTTSVPQTQLTPLNPAFLMSQLINVTQTPNDARFAEFSSTLTVDISQIQAQNIREINCGDPGTIDSEQINVVTQQLTAPNNPVITAVTAIYTSGVLSNLEIQWTNTENCNCPDYSNLIYQVNSSTVHSSLVDYTGNCMEDICVTNFEDVAIKNELIKVSILAINKFGTSNLISYPAIIASFAQQFFIPKVASDNNVFMVQCISSTENITESVCGVRYTTDPLYTGLSEQFTTMLNTPLEIPELSADVTYYFEFTLIINSSLRISERILFPMQTSTGTDDPAPFNLTTIVAIAGGSFSLLVIILIIIIIICIVRHRVKKLNMEEQTYDLSTPIPIIDLYLVTC